MRNHAIRQHQQKIKAIFDLADIVLKSRTFQPSDAANLNAELARYACVLISGFVEKAVRELCLDYATRKSARNFARYVEKTWRDSQSMKAEVLLQIIGAFNETWRDQLDTELQTDGRGEALDAIVNLRNSIAHGGTGSTSLTNVKDYYKKIIEVVDFLEELLDS
jgi:hypothetical protein